MFTFLHAHIQVNELECFLKQRLYTVSVPLKNWVMSESLCFVGGFTVLTCSISHPQSVQIYANENIPLKRRSLVLH